MPNTLLSLVCVSRAITRDKRQMLPPPVSKLMTLRQSGQANRNIRQPDQVCHTLEATGNPVANSMEDNMASNNQSGQGQGQVKDPKNDQRLKENDGGQQGQGQVKDPKNDGRLKQNDGGQQGQGQVRDPENDGRLKDNR